MSAKDNPVYIATPLKDDSLVLRQATYRESLGQPFELDAELISLDESIAFDELLGKNVTLRFETEDGTRYLNGLVTGFKQLENLKRLGHYQAEIRPWFWLLTLSKHCRIFQQKSYPDILQAVFDEMGFSDYKNKLRAKYSKQEYVVQFNETDFEFVTRIMQQEGIYYCFEHTNGKHTMVLYDDVASAQNLGRVSYHDIDEKSYAFDVEGIFDWQNYQQIRTSGISLSSYDFEVPGKNLVASVKDAKSKTFTQLQYREFNNTYSQRSTGERYAKVLMEQQNAAQEIKQFSGNMRTLAAGSSFKLSEHPRDDQNTSYFVTDFCCTVRTGEVAEESAGNKLAIYECSGQAISSKSSFRLPQTLSKPRMSGPQTATVVGKLGATGKDQIWTDKYGRIKVRFHWDKSASVKDSSSCWIRVAQSVAGKNWGSLSIPRIGQEVLVDFLQGDPDQPIVIGCIYNGASMPPYALPKLGHLIGFRSTTTAKDANVNEIRFDDKAGQEQLYFSAAKNQDVMVANDCFETIGADRHLTVKKNQFEKVANNRSEDIGASLTTKVGGDSSYNIKGKEAKQVGGSRSLSVQGNCGEAYSGNLSVRIDKDGYIKAGNLCLEASNNITFKVGNTYIAMESGGISIHSAGKIAIDAKQNLALEGGAKTEVNGKGSTSIKGKMVKIN